MPSQVKKVKPPRGINRWLFRMPIALYHLGLGGLFGKRMVRLTHTGRRSGIPRQVILEVVRYIPEDGSCIVAAGFGKESDWVRNIKHDPRITYTIGRDNKNGKAVRLDEDTAAQELIQYSHDHPKAWKELAHIMGYQLDGTEADTRELGKLIHMFVFKPTKKIT